MAENLKNKNILYAVPTMNSGGVEVGIIEIAKQNYLVKGFNMFVLCTSGLLKNKLQNLGVNVIYLNIKTKNPFKIYRNISKIRKILIENKIDLVCVESRAPAWSCYFACKKLNVPLITTIHGAYNNGQFFSKIFKKFYNSIMFRGENIIFVSQYIKDYSTKFFKKFISKKNKIKNTIVIPRGVDLNIFNKNNINLNRVIVLQDDLKVPDDRLIITLPARFTKLKGHIYFLKVLRFLSLYTQNFICVMVGDLEKHPKFIKKLHKIIFKYKLSNYIKIHNNINDMTALYTLSNIIVSSSIKAESFGRISIEAQAMEKIFIGTALGGTLETVDDCKNGFLAPHDDEKTFAKILSNIINMSEEEKNIIKKNGLENSKKYSLEEMYNKTLNFYNNILSKK